MKQLVSVVQVCILGCMIEANITNTIWMIIIIHLSCNSSTSTLLLLCLLGWSLNEKLSSLLWWLQWELLSLSDSLLSRSVLSENVSARGTTARFCIWDREKQAPHLWWKRKIVYLLGRAQRAPHLWWKRKIVYMFGTCVFRIYIHPAPFVRDAIFPHCL